MTLSRRTLRWPALVAAAAVLPWSAAAQRATRDRSVVVSVVNKQGAPVTDLTLKDFVVRENDLAREVTRVAPAPPPTHIALLVDDSAATNGLAPFLRPALASFVKQVTGVPDPPQIGLWTFGERPTRRVPFTKDVEAVQKEVGRFFPVTNAGAYFLEATAEAIAELRKRGAERPMIVAFVSESGPEFSSQLETQITEGLRSIGASLWTVTLQFDPPNTLQSIAARERAKVLGESTERSGGTNDVILTPQGLETAFGRIAGALGARYLVTYGRPESLIPPDKMQVEVKRPDVRVRATRWAGQ